MADATLVESKVLDIIAAQAKADRATVSRDTELETLSLDSLDIVEIIFSIEEAFDISIPYNANDPTAAGISFKTAGNVVDAVKNFVK